MNDKPQSYTWSDYLRSGLSIMVFFLLLIFFTPVILLLLIVTAGKASNVVVEKMAPVIAKSALRVAGIRFSITYHLPKPLPAAIYTINHSSTLDVLTLLAMGLPKIRFVAKWEFQYNPIFLILGRLTGQVFIRRHNSEKAVQTLQKNITRIKSGKLSLMMAPEGSRSHSGVIGTFKKGPFRMAMDLGYPIVPIYFEGNRKLSSGRFVITKAGRCTAHIFPAIATDAWQQDHLEEHIKSVRDKYLVWAKMEENNQL